jgi:hypothetical protein
MSCKAVAFDSCSFHTAETVPSQEVLPSMFPEVEQVVSLG